MENQSLRGASVIVERGLICRMCMGNREYSVNIFYCSEVYKIPVCNVMMDLLHVEVSEDDGLPDTVCRRCVRKLLKFKEFKELCLKSATELRKSAKESYFFCPAKDEELGYSERAVEIIDATYSTGDDVPITAPSIVTQGPLAVDNMCPMKEDEERVIEVVAEEEIKRENDIIEGLNSGLTAAPNMDPVVVESISEVRGTQLSLIKEESSGEIDASEYDILEIGIAGFDVTSPASVNEHVKEEDTPCVTEAGAISNDGDSCDVDHSVVTPIRNITSEPIVVNSCVESGDFSREQGQMSSNVGVMELGTLPNNSSLISKDGQSAQGDNSTKTSTSHSLTLMPNLKPLSNGTSEKILNKATNLTSQSKAHKGTLECDKFGKQFHESNTLAKHRTIHSGISFKCQMCVKEFHWKSSFVAHTAIHSAEKPHKCQVCGIAFIVKRKLVRHSRVHEKPSSFDCNSCGRKFRQKGYLSNHITIHCGKRRDGPFKCDKCGKEFYNRSTLRSHRSIHSGVTFKCEFCGKEFYLKSNFIAHVVIHSEEKPFKCETCGKHFNLKSKLARHCVVHNDLRPFGCDVCGKYFKRKGYLLIHMDIHTGVKRFKCDICLKAFGQWSTLKRHSLTHTKLSSESLVRGNLIENAT